MALVSPLTSSAFVRLMKKDLDEVSDNEYNDLPQQGKALYRVLSTSQAQSEFYGVSGLPEPSIFDFGPIPVETKEMNDSRVTDWALAILGCQDFLSRLLSFSAEALDLWPAARLTGVRSTETSVWATGVGHVDLPARLSRDSPMHRQDVIGESKSLARLGGRPGKGR